MFRPPVSVVSILRVDDGATGSIGIESFCIVSVAPTDVLSAEVDSVFPDPQLFRHKEKPNNATAMLIEKVPVFIINKIIV